MRLCAVFLFLLVPRLGWAAEAVPSDTELHFAAFEKTLQENGNRRTACSNLFEFVEATIKAAEGTPGKEAANFLRTGSLGYAVQGLRKGEVPSNVAMYGLRQQTSIAAKGPGWPKPPVIEIPYARQAPVIDGKLDEAIWGTAATFTNSYAFNETNVARVTTTYRILWDTNYLYFAFDCEDADVVAPVQTRDEPIYRDDCVEMFILPDPRFKVYWEIDVSPSGCIFDSLQVKRLNEWGAMMDSSENIEGLKIGTTVRGTLNDSTDRDKGYTMEIAVPFRQLPGYSQSGPVAGQSLSLMLARIDHNRNETVEGQGTNGSFTAYAFVPLLSWGHNLWNHPRAILKQ